MPGRLETIRVELGERSYDIAVGSGTLGDLGGRMKGLGLSPRAAVVTNPTVRGLYGAPVEASLREAGFDPAWVVVPDGEEYKSLLWMERIWGEMLKAGLDRRSAVVALGGGVIGDMAGFAASAYMRGVPCVQVPTTLLAQVDSSVGGKTGVNHPLGKNMIGAFWQPSLVWIDVETLGTLPRRELLAGMAEVVKYGVIWDEGFFGFLENNRDAVLGLDPGAVVRVIRRSCEIKAEVVSRDEREGGLRAILNYGHTIGHGIETAAGYGRYLHGEAVAMGMVLEARLALAMGVAGEGEASRIRGLVEHYGLPSGLPPEADPGAVLKAIRLDKKALAGTLRFVLPEAVGRVRVNEPVGEEDLLRALERARG
ncbi:MAG: 3-dehydroquinate synthase [Thermodesulfovibrionales bacterium]